MLFGCYTACYAMAGCALGYRPVHDLKSGLATVWQEFTTPPPQKERQHSEQS